MDAHQAACSALAGFAVAAVLTSGAAAADTRVAVTLDSAVTGPAAPFLLPIDTGGYRAEGLAVAVEPAATAQESIARVAAGDADMGVADINALIRARDANPALPVKAVFMVYNRPAYAVIARKSRGIAAPKDLEGKTIGAPAADPAVAQWPLFAQINGIDAGKVSMQNVGLPVREPMLAAGQVDAIIGLSFQSYVDLKERGVPLEDIAVMPMADYGVELYGNAIVANTNFAAENPGAVKAFLRAFVKGLRETVKQPARAVDSVLKRNDAVRRATETERLAAAIRDTIVTAEVRADGYGGIDTARFARAIDQLALAAKFRNAKPQVTDVFDASFLPPAAERRYP